MNHSSNKKSSRVLADPDVFQEFYEILHIQLYRFMLTRLSFDRAAAEDLTAETFLRAWRKRNSFYGTPKSVKYWIFRIGRNLLIDQTRKKRPARLDEFVEQTIIGEYLSDAHVIDREFSDTMWKIFHQLPPEKKEILIFRYVLQWQVKEIAEYLEINENTASKRIHRALESIRNQWPEDLLDE